MKAFVGPLGDDFPSIFPIVAGVLLFLGTIVYAAGVVDEKNNYFELRKASLGLGYILTQKGRQSPAEFQALCETQAKEFARSKAVKFHAALRPQCNGIEFYDDFTESVTKGTYEAASCDSHKEGETYDLAEIGSKNPVVVNYPLAAPCPMGSSYMYGLGVVTIVVWR